MNAEERNKMQDVYEKYNNLFYASDVEGIRKYTLEFKNNIQNISDEVILCALTACLPHCFQERTDLFNTFKQKCIANPEYSEDPKYSPEEIFDDMMQGLEPEKFNVTNNLDDVLLVNMFTVFKTYNYLFQNSDFEGVRKYTTHLLNQLPTLKDDVVISALTGCLPHTFQERTDLYNAFKLKCQTSGNYTEERLTRLLKGLEPEAFTVSKDLPN